MRNTYLLVSVVLFIGSFFLNKAIAITKENEHSHHTNHSLDKHHGKQNLELKKSYHGNDSIKRLPEDVRLLLQQEMREIQKAMKMIFDAYAVGDYKTIADLAGKIKESFILKQKLSQQQKHALHKGLPHGFLKKDIDFHYSAGMLKRVATEQNQELVGFYFHKLADACLSCHQKYAKHRFPSLDSNTKGKAKTNEDKQDSSEALHHHH